MYQNILVPLDGSELAERVLTHLETLVASTHAHITLVRVTPEPVHPNGRPLPPNGAGVYRQPVDLESAKASSVFAGTSATTTDAHIQAEVERATEYLEETAAGLRKRGMQVRVMTVAAAKAADGIAQVAQSEHVDLIAMSTHGRGGIGRLLLGSVADRVVLSGVAPILLVRSARHMDTAAQPPSFSRIVIPLDGSTHAESALAHARAFAECERAHVLLLRVVPQLSGDLLTEQLVPILPTPQMRQSSDTMPALAETALGRAQQSAQSYLHAVAERIEDWQVPVEALTQVGDPAEVILETAAAFEAQLIVIATHGVGGLQRMLLGSVADKLVRHASAAVLVTH